MTSIFQIVCVASILCSFQSVIADDKLIIKQMPSYFVYENQKESSLSLSDFKNLLLATSGVSINKAIEWTGLKTTDTKSVPKATFLFLAESASLNNMFSSDIHVPIVDDSSADFNFLKDSFNGVNRVAIIHDTLQNESTTVLEEECSKDSIVNVYHVAESETQDLAKKIDEIVGNFASLCSIDAQKEVLVYVLATSQHAKIVKKRAATDSKLLQQNILNLAPFYSDQYPAMFNLIFWTTLILAVAIIGITYGMMNMDPGLDTVIYRMTSNRIKKEN